MRLPGFTAGSSLIKPKAPYHSKARPGEEHVARSLVAPQARQVGPWIHGIVQYCGDNVCLLFKFDDAGCRPVNFSNF